MLTFTLPDMTCGHCVRAVEQAIRDLDPSARVVVDLASHGVRIETDRSHEDVAQRLAAAGYPPGVTPPR